VLFSKKKVNKGYSAESCFPKDKNIGYLRASYCIVSGFYTSMQADTYVKGRVYCFSMQVVTNKCILLNPEKKFGADPSCPTLITS